MKWRFMTTKCTWSLIPLIIPLMLVLPVFAEDSGGIAPVAREQLARTYISWQPHVSYARLNLIVAGPDGMMFTREFAADVSPSLNLATKSGAPLPDGFYKYELTVIPLAAQLPKAAADGARTSDGTPDARSFQPLSTQTKARKRLVQSGHFRIHGGTLVGSEVEEKR